MKRKKRHQKRVNPKGLITRITETFNTTVSRPKLKNMILTALAIARTDKFRINEISRHLPVAVACEKTRQKRLDGLLHARQIEGEFGLGGIELIAFPGPHQQLTITATGLRTQQNASFGIALGKHFPPHPDAPPRPGRTAPHHYVFRTDSIGARQFSGGGGSAPFFRWAAKHPCTIWDTKAELKEMVLVFNASRFQMFGNGELRADFVDEHFDQIEIITIVIGGNDMVTAKASMDSFTISGPVLDVFPKGKATVTWGELKSKR